jgi:hypothetical protein
MWINNATVWACNNGNPIAWEGVGGAFDYIYATVNVGAGYAGHTDWRLPNIRELMSIVNYEEWPAVFDELQLPELAPLDADYWTSTSESDSQAWVINLHDGRIRHNVNKAFANGRMILVRNDGILPDTGNAYDDPDVITGLEDGTYNPVGNQPTYNNNMDGTVTDDITGLMWSRNNLGGVRTWERALDFCEELVLCNDGTWTNDDGSMAGPATTHGGVRYDAWRLPDVKELESIIDYGQTNPCVNPVFVANANWHWTSTTFGRDLMGTEAGGPSPDLTRWALAIRFQSGDVGVQWKGWMFPTFARIRPVRGPGLQQGEWSEQPYVMLP